MVFIGMGLPAPISATWVTWRPSNYDSIVAVSDGTSRADVLRSGAASQQSAAGSIPHSNDHKSASCTPVASEE
jgi:hypothetical protein